jgi:predicted phage terminase large subunit-like protein
MLHLPARDEVDAELAARRLSKFTPMAWPVFESVDYKSNWHIEAICEHLEAVSAGQIRRLIINIPPRHMKSSTVAVAWPCWEWLRRPETRWLFVSYAQALSKRDSLKCRRIIESKGGRLEGGTLIERVGYEGLRAMLGQDWQLASDQNEKLRFENTRTGYRLATSRDGTATGEGGDIIVIDDPHKASEVESETERDNVVEFLDGTLSTRLNDPATGRIVMVMQRLHEKDATGHLLAQGGYEHLCLPAEFNPTHPFRWPDDPRTEPGDLLWPDHFTKDAVDDLKLRLGSYRAAGQLQQLPAPAEGGIFKTAWWQYYDPTLLARLDELALDDEVENPGLVCGLPHFTKLIQSWDTALKEKTSSDYAVGGLWGWFGPDRYLLRKAKGLWGMTDTVTAMVDLTAWAKRRFPHLTPTIYVENKANGPEVIAAARKKVQGIVPTNPSVDKVARAEAVTPQLEGGNVYVPGDRTMTSNGWSPDTVRTPAWVQETITECASFPKGANDDEVDMVSQALNPTRFAATTPKKKDRPRKQTVAARMRAGGV